MDKYQSALIGKATNMTLSSTEGVGSCRFENETLILVENENYHIEKYILTIENPSFDSIIYKNEKIMPEHGVIKLLIDFKNPEKAFHINFIDGFADSCDVELKFIHADAQAYDLKIEKNTIEALKANMKVFARTADCLINIYWKKSCEAVTTTMIHLYTQNDTETYSLDKFKVQGETFYKSIAGLAYGAYFLSVSQLDANGRVIIEDSLSITLEDTHEKLLKSLQPQVRGFR